MKKNFSARKDAQNSSFVLVVYFFKDATQSSTYKKDFYSKWEQRPEEPEPMSRLRKLAHDWKGNGYGYRCALIYNNQDPNPDKKPIVRIESNGREK